MDLVEWIDKSNKQADNMEVIFGQALNKMKRFSLLYMLFQYVTNTLALHSLNLQLIKIDHYSKMFIRQFLIIKKQVVPNEDNY